MLRIRVGDLDDEFLTNFQLAVLRPPSRRGPLPPRPTAGGTDTGLTNPDLPSVHHAAVQD